MGENFGSLHLHHLFHLFQVKQSQTEFLKLDNINHNAMELSTMNFHSTVEQKCHIAIKSDITCEYCILYSYTILGTQETSHGNQS